MTTKQSSESSSTSILITFIIIVLFGIGIGYLANMNSENERLEDREKLENTPKKSSAYSNDRELMRVPPPTPPKEPLFGHPDPNSINIHNNGKFDSASHVMSKARTSVANYVFGDKVQLESKCEQIDIRITPDPFNYFSESLTIGVTCKSKGKTIHVNVHNKDALSKEDRNSDFYNDINFIENHEKFFSYAMDFESIKLFKCGKDYCINAHIPKQSHILKTVPPEDFIKQTNAFANDTNKVINKWIEREAEEARIKAEWDEVRKVSKEQFLKNNVKITK